MDFTWNTHTFRIFDDPRRKTKYFHTCAIITTHDCNNNDDWLSVLCFWSCPYSVPIYRRSLTQSSTSRVLIHLLVTSWNVYSCMYGAFKWSFFHGPLLVQRIIYSNLMEHLSFSKLPLPEYDGLLDRTPSWNQLFQHPLGSFYHKHSYIFPRTIKTNFWWVCSSEFRLSIPYLDLIGCEWDCLLYLLLYEFP
jgi:hypothetical protein